MSKTEIDIFRSSRFCGWLLIKPSIGLESVQ